MTNLAAQMMLAPAWRCSLDRSNDKMVDIFVEAGLISCKDVEDAFRAIPRGAFVPNEQFDEAYFDSPLRGDPHVHMSAPHMYATVLEALDLCPGQSFLNVGSGTGYFSCLVGYLIKHNSVNHGIEQYTDLVDYCKERCDYFMRHTPIVANEMSRPVFLSGNCFRLDNRDRQYDRIYCGAACPPSKVPFILSMTKVGGFAIIPCKNKLLKIDRVSPTGVKQSVIREVSFASLAPLANSETSLPKLKFPPAGDKKRVKTLKVYPPSDLLISNGSSRRTLAQLRALQNASECLQSSQPLPLPFCYVPDETQLKVLKATKKIKETSKTSTETQTSSAVDSKITFFNSCSGQPDHETEVTDTWDFLNSDKLWENVVEHYYSICTDTKEDKLKAMTLYVRKKAARHCTSGRAPSYADLMMKLGLLVNSPLQKSVSEAKEKNQTLCSSSKDNEKESNCSSSTVQTLAVACVDESSSSDDAGQSEVKSSLQKTVSFDSEEHSRDVVLDTVAQIPASTAVESSGTSASCALECITCTKSNTSSTAVECTNSNASNTGVESTTSTNSNTSSSTTVESTTTSTDSNASSTAIESITSTDSNASSTAVESTTSTNSNASSTAVEFTTSTDSNASNTGVESTTTSTDSNASSTTVESTTSTDSNASSTAVESATSTNSNASNTGVESTTSTNSNASSITVESDSKDCILTTSRADDSNDGPSLITKEPLGASALSSDPSENKLDKEASCKEAHDKRKMSRDRKKSSSSEGSRKKSIPECVDVLIEVDKDSMMKLNTLPKKSWCLEDDKELVRFLSDASDKTGKGRCKGWFKPELTRPSLFSRLDSLSYPRLASISADDLTFRTVALCRIASILDSCLYLLTGSSLLNDFNTTKPKYPMDSFDDLSFESSRNSNNVRFDPLPVELKREPKETTPFGMMDAAQLKIQFELTSKKLKLTQDLQEQIKEQQKVLRKQASLLEEKQQLIQNLSLLDIHRQTERSSEPQLIVELKTQRQEVLNRIQKLVDQHASQETKKTELLEELKQVKEERNRALELEARKKEEAESLNTTVEQDQPSEPSTAPPKDTKPLSPCTHPRYQISCLLPHLRFLLPLCRQRWRLVQEMLHASEHSPPDHMPIVTVDRRTPLMERGGRPEASVLLQVYKELRPEGLNYRWNKWKYEQWWEVKFVGEGIIDQGGGFRDSLIEIADEICPPGKNASEVLPFFIRTPNNKDDTGDYQDAYIPTPFSKQWCIYEWIGKMFGAVYRTDENLTVSCPPFFWKSLVGEHVTWARDYADIDESVVRFTDALEVSDEELYDAAYGVDCKFSAVLSDGTRVDLIPGGENIDVKSSDRQQFARLLREARMTEAVKQVLAVRRGLISVVPESVLRLLTWAELERGVCGNPDVSLSVLKSACKYGDDLSESTECIKYFWSALSKFTNDERSRFLRFVTGRRRPPAPFTVVKAGGSNELPNASTCASSLFWPNYPSAAVATARLRYAIYNCIAIDTDTSPW